MTAALIAAFAAVGLLTGAAANATQWRDEDGQVNLKLWGVWIASLVGAGLLTATGTPEALAYLACSAGGFGLSRSLSLGLAWQRLRRLNRASGRQRVLLLENAEDRERRREAMAELEMRRRIVLNVLNECGTHAGLAEMRDLINELADRDVPTVLDRAVHARLARDDAVETTESLSRREIPRLEQSLLDDARSDLEEFKDELKIIRGYVEKVTDFLNKLTTDAHQVKLDMLGNDGIGERVGQLKGLRQEAQALLECERFSLDTKRDRLVVNREKPRSVSNTRSARERYVKADLGA